MNSPGARRHTERWYALVAAAAWTSLAAGSAVWDVRAAGEEARNIASMMARSAYDT